VIDLVVLIIFPGSARPRASLLCATLPTTAGRAASEESSLSPSAQPSRPFITPPTIAIISMKRR
jgi:hypothetical protein